MPPACIEGDRVFRFSCTPDPVRPGQCMETMGAITIDAAKKIADEFVCGERTRDWLRIEREARSNGQNSGS